MAPKVTGASLAALRHPWLVSLASGVVLFAWGLGAIRLRVVEATIYGLVVFGVQVFLWVPPFGPARRYTERLLREEGSGPGPPG